MLRAHRGLGILQLLLLRRQLPYTTSFLYQLHHFDIHSDSSCADEGSQIMQNILESKIINLTYIATFVIKRILSVPLEL